MSDLTDQFGSIDIYLFDQLLRGRIAPGMRVVARHGVDSAPGGSRATLSLELQGLFGGLFGKLTRGITERYLVFEASGLKARSENPRFRHAGVSSPGTS